MGLLDNAILAGAKDLCCLCSHSDLLSVVWQYGSRSSLEAWSRPHHACRATLLWTTMCSRAPLTTPTLSRWQCNMSLWSKCEVNTRASARHPFFDGRCAGIAQDSTLINSEIAHISLGFGFASNMTRVHLEVACGRYVGVPGHSWVQLCLPPCQGVHTCSSPGEARNVLG